MKARLSHFPKVLCVPANKVGVQNGTAKYRRVRKDEAKLQGAQMLALRLTTGKTQTELGQLFACNRNTVAKRLSEAITPDLQQMARDVITERLIPKAVGVLEAELEKGNYQAAKDVLNGLQVFQTGGKATIEHVTSSSPTLDAIRRERAKAIDGQVVSVEETVITKQLPEAPNDDGAR